jgi:hypothetical protein
MSDVAASETATEAQAARSGPKRSQAPVWRSWRLGSMFHSGGAEDVTLGCELAGVMHLQLIGTPYRKPRAWRWEIHVGGLWRGSTTICDPRTYATAAEARAEALRGAGEVLVCAMRRLAEIGREEP